MFMVPITGQSGQRGKASPKITYIKAPIQEAKNTLSYLSETFGDRRNPLGGPMRIYRCLELPSIIQHHLSCVGSSGDTLDMLPVPHRSTETGHHTPSH